MAKVGLRNPIFVPGTYSDGQATVYGTGIRMGKAVSANITFTRTDAYLDADDAKAESDKSVTGGDIALTLDDLTAANAAAILGYTAITESTNTVGYTVKDSDAPYGAFTYIRKRILNGVVSYLVYWVYKVQFGQESDEASTMQSSGTQFQTTPLSGAMLKAYEGFYSVYECSSESAAVTKQLTLAGLSEAA